MIYYVKVIAFNIYNRCKYENDITHTNQVNSKVNAKSFVVIIVTVDAKIAGPLVSSWPRVLVMLPII